MKMDEMVINEDAVLLRDFLLQWWDECIQLQMKDETKK